jgi:putative oxidoreductase
MPSELTSRLSAVALNLLRIVTGFLFWQHGAQKILGLFGGFGDGGMAPFGSIFWVAGLMELIGGPLVMLGLFTRPVAFLLSGEMAVAYFSQHAPQGFWPIENRGELPVLFCVIFFYLAVHGGGRFSLDCLLRRRRAKEALPPPPSATQPATGRAR